MALSAADLQKKHELEGTPDPFPSLADSPARARNESPRQKQVLDTESHTAFPSLAASTPVQAPVKSTWGSSNGHRIKPVAVKSTIVSDSFTLAPIDLSAAGRDGKPATIGEIMKNVMAKYKVKIEASANQKSRQTTFHVKADTQKDLEKAKRALLAALSPVVSLILNAPASTIATIIGPKGATLRQVRDQTGVRVDIPPKDDHLSPPQVNGHASGKTSPVASGDDEEEEPTVPITITGPQTSAEEARALLAQIISVKTARTTQRVRDIPPHVLPFVLARKPTFQAAAAGGDAALSLNADAREIVVAGDREAVGRVIDSIRSAVDSFSASLKILRMPLPRQNHRLLAGRAADEIMGASRCAVIIPKADEPGDEVAIWGQSADLAGGVSAVMSAVNSKFVKAVKLPGSESTAKQVLTYLGRIGYAKTVAEAHPGVSVFPAPQTVSLDVVGDKPDVEAAVTTIQDFFGKLAGATQEVPIDWLLHRVVLGKNSKKLKQLYEAHNVQVYFPPEAAEQSTVLLVYDPLSTNGASATSVQKASHLEAAAKDVAKLAKEAADVKSETLMVDNKWHDAVSGPGGTTLNAIIGEDKTLVIKLNSDANTIEVRGVGADVDGAVKEVLRIVENAKNDEIVNSYSIEFDIEREYVGRVVGAHGTGINKLRDQLGVKVDVSDEIDDKEYKDTGKKKKASLGSHQKSKVKITGRKENAEEAKRRILAQVERLADETSEVLKIPAQFHSSLIGQNGKYAIRLEEKYSVKITFPRQAADGGEGKTREQLKPDEVLVKGGRKGVAGAKSELMDALEFEKESNHVSKFTVPTRSVARILGRGGASINDIKDSTGAQIDVDKGTEATGATTHITLRGTQKAINEAKAAILAISDQVGEETTETLNIENRFHRTLIGAGGQGLRDLIARCGGPADQKAQAGLIRFPRQGEPSDEVRLRGEPKLVAKLKTELEKTSKELRDRVVLGVDIPAGQHRALIGRGGQHLNDLQARTGAQVQFPGSRSYNQVGEPENAADLKDTSPANIIKLSGPRAACEKAIAELRAQVKPPSPESVTAMIEVPLKYHHAISQQGNFFRHLRSFGVQVDQSATPQKSAVPSRPPQEAQVALNSARIDNPDGGDGDGDEAGVGAQWEVIPNYQDAEEGNSVWNLKARDQAALDKACTLIAEAVAQASRMSHVGFLTLPDRSMFPRIVGTKGANVARLRTETGADITVGRDNSTIIIIGSETDILNAKEAIMKMPNTGGGRGQRRHHD